MTLHVPAQLHHAAMDPFATYMDLTECRAGLSFALLLATDVLLISYPSCMPIASSYCRVTVPGRAGGLNRCVATLYAGKLRNENTNATDRGRLHSGILPS